VYDLRRSSHCTPKTPVYFYFCVLLLQQFSSTNIASKSGILISKLLYEAQDPRLSTITFKINTHIVRTIRVRVVSSNSRESNQVDSQCHMAESAVVRAAEATRAIRALTVHTQFGLLSR
jgi:hypothetical protein